MSTPVGHRDGWRIIVTDDNPTKLYALTMTLRDAGHCVVQLPDIDLLITNTRLGFVDGPELMRRSRDVLPGLAILHVMHHGDSADGTPLGVPTLREPFTPNQLLLVVGSLLA